MTDNIMAIRRMTDNIMAIRRMTDNIMAKRKRTKMTNNGEQNTTKKTKD
jgi:hypothetical protein